MRDVLTVVYVVEGVAYVSGQGRWRIQRLIQGSCLLGCIYLKNRLIDRLGVEGGMVMGM